MRLPAKSKGMIQPALLPVRRDRRWLPRMFPTIRLRLPSTPQRPYAMVLARLTPIRLFRKNVTGNITISLSFNKSESALAGVE
jgi:hypothetical protein